MRDLPWDMIVEITSRIRGDFIAWTSTCKAMNTLNTPEEEKKSISFGKTAKSFPG